MKSVSWLAALLVVAAVLPACATVTVTKRGISRIEAEPTHRKQLDFFLWGLAGGPKEVDAAAICGSRREPVQLQAQTTLGDCALTLLTLGIYAPRSAKVWCQ
jgi:hypothetical protein